MPPEFLHSMRGKLPRMTTGANITLGASAASPRSLTRDQIGRAMERKRVTDNHCHAGGGTHLRRAQPPGEAAKVPLHAAEPAVSSVARSRPPPPRPARRCGRRRSSAQQDRRRAGAPRRRCRARGAG